MERGSIVSAASACWSAPAGAGAASFHQVGTQNRRRARVSVKGLAGRYVRADLAVLDAQLPATEPTSARSAPQTAYRDLVAVHREVRFSDREIVPLTTRVDGRLPSPPTGPPNIKPAGYVITQASRFATRLTLCARRAR
jgi:hypothetical protein